MGRFARNEAISQGAAIAREAAESGFGVATAQLREAPTARPSASDVQVQGASNGTYSFRVVDDPNGTVKILATGEYQDARYEIDGEIIPLFATGAGLFVHAEEVKIEVKDDAVLNGHDHRPPSVATPLRAGAGLNRPAIVFTDAEIHAQTMAEMKPEHIARLLGTTRTGMAGAPIALYDLVETVRTSPGTVTTGKLDLKHTTVGSPSAPVVFYATDDVKLGQGFTGYGLLIADEEVKLERGAQWEGLIILRAEADSKAKLEIKDDSRVVGAVVLLGEEDLLEEPNSPGLPGGHFDIDIFEGERVCTGGGGDDDEGEGEGEGEGGSCTGTLERTYHKHEWDDTYNLTYLDFLTGPDLSSSFQDFKSRMGVKDIRVTFENEFNGSGTYSVRSGPLSWAGVSRNGFDQTMKLNSLNELRLDLVSLLELRGTYPGRVNDDDVGRDRAFTVRFFDGSTLVYAVSVYEHVKGQPRDGMSAPLPGPSTEGIEVYGEFEVKIEDEGAILYSEEAVARIGSVLATIRSNSTTRTIVTRSVPIRP